MCTARAVRAYFENEVVPGEGAVCEPDELPLVDMSASSVEDIGLFGKMKRSSSVIPRFGKRP